MYVNSIKHLINGLIFMFFLGCISINTLFAQVFTIDGITGIELNEYGQDSVVTVSDSFSVFNVVFTPDSLVLTYKEQEKELSIRGKSIIGFEDEQIEVKLNLTINNKSLTAVIFEVSTNFTLKNLELKPVNLGFEWVSGNIFGLFGTVVTKVEDEEMTVSLGDAEEPGITINDGSIENFSMAITGNFKAKSIEIKPIDVTFKYSIPNDQFEMFGDAIITLDDDDISINMGDSINPGIIYANNKITHLNFGISADFSIKELEVSPKDVTFEYDSDSTHFIMYGNIDLKIDDDTIDAYLGDSDEPGLIYSDSKIHQINMGISNDFTVSGLKVKTKDIGILWSNTSGVNEFKLYGDADLSIDNDTLDTDFGTPSEPGLVIRKSSLYSFNVDVNSDLKLGNLEVVTKDLDIRYSNARFELTGEMEIKEIFSLTVILGQGNQEGIEIDVSGNEPRFKVEDLEIKIEHANLGAIDLKNFDLKFDQHGIIESDVDVIFPEGWEVEAKLKFDENPARLNSIKIDYRADDLEKAIEIFEGVQLSYLGAEVNNLDHPSRLSVSGDIGTIYGGGFTLDGKSATLLHMRDNITISPKYFELKGDVNLGAYRTNSDDWHSLLGSGKIDLSVGTKNNWSGVRASADVKIPGDPLIEADATVTLDNHKNFDALIDLEFIVPHWVPFIGGHHYGNIDGAVRYKHHMLNQSYGAGWVHFKIFWHTIHVGAKYNFGNRRISGLSGHSINTIKREINNDQKKSNSNIVKPKIISHTFELDNLRPSAMLVEIDWTESVDSALISVIGPMGYYELTKAVVQTQGDSLNIPVITHEENMNLVFGDTSTVFHFTSIQSFNDDSSKVSSILYDGRYQLVISFFNDVSAIDTVTFNPIWDEPVISIDVEKGESNDFNFTIDHWSSVPDSTILSLYVSSTPDRVDPRLIDHVINSNSDEQGYGSIKFNFRPDFVVGTDTLYFYGIIDDGVNPPKYSLVSNGFIYEPSLIGYINFPDDSDSLRHGLRVYIDEDLDGSFDVLSTGGLEPFGITDSLGYFSIDSLTPDKEYELRIVLPNGYRIQGQDDSFGSETIKYIGSGQKVVIDVENYVEDE